MALLPTVIYNHVSGNVDSVGVHNDRALLNQRCAAAFDTLATISLLAVGILGTLNVIGIPPAAAYACFGGAGLIVLIPTFFVTLAGCTRYKHLQRLGSPESFSKCLYERFQAICINPNHGKQ